MQSRGDRAVTSRKVDNLLGVGVAGQKEEKDSREKIVFSSKITRQTDGPTS